MTVWSPVIIRTSIPAPSAVRTASLAALRSGSTIPTSATMTRSVTAGIGSASAAVIAPSEGHLRGMAVRPAWQGRGVAKQLLDAAESELAAKGCSRISLDTTGPLKRAVAFYEKNGYRASGKITDFFGMRLYEYVKTLR